MSKSIKRTKAIREEIDSKTSCYAGYWEGNTDRLLISLLLIIAEKLEDIDEWNKV